MTPASVRSLRHRAPVLWLLSPLMIGLIAGKTAPALPSPAWLLAGALILALIATVMSARAGVWSCAIGAALILTGAAYYEMRRERLPVWETLPTREARLTLHVLRTFAPPPDGKRSSGLARVSGADPHLRELLGQKLYFSIARRDREPPPVRASEIVVLGVLKPLPRDAAANTFDGYLANSGANFRFTRGRIAGVAREPGAYRRFCQRTQERLAMLLGRGLETHPDLTAISRAMLLGLQQELSDEQNRWFMQSGTMHLFSISGLHIAVIALALERVLALLRVTRATRFAISAVLLWLYVDITGASPSAVRAYIMVMLLETSLVLRLPVNPVATLSLAATISLAIDPMQLFSASFQMSYGIVAALLLLGLPLADFWNERWQLFRWLPKATWSWRHRTLSAGHRGLLATLAIGVATAVVSTLCGILYFDLFTPGALIANLVLIPVGSLVILSGFLALVSGLAGLDWLCATFNHAAGLVLWLTERGIDFFVRLPGVYFDAQFSVSWIGFSGLMVVLAAIFLGYANRWDRTRGGVWVPFALAAAILVFGVKFG